MSMLSSFNTSFANTTTSPQIVPDGQSNTLLKVSDSNAKRQADLQASGKPWPCVKHKITVTNEKCKAMKIASDTRQCSDCGLPLALGIVTREELQMGKTQKRTCPACGQECLALFGKRKVCWTCREDEKAAKISHTCLPTDEQGYVTPASKQLVVGSEDHFAEPSNMVGAPTKGIGINLEKWAARPDELSWDDFIDIAPYRQPEQLSAHIRAGEYLTISVGIVRKLKWSHGDGVLVRRDAAGNSLALRHDGAYAKGKNLKVTAGSNNSASLRVCCSQALKEVAAVSGSHRVTVTPWGVVIHLDRPVEGKGEAA